MPFGLTNASATFQRNYELGVSSIIDKKGVDILVYFATLEENLALLQQVFDLLRTHKFYIKLSKCSFAQ